MNHQRSLLIVEDSDEDFEVTCWALEQAGFSGPVIRCARAEEARRLLCPGPPHTALTPSAVLLDLNLPGINGIELLEEARRSDRAIAVPVVILSTSSNPRDIADCYRLGAAGYLCKPLSIEVYVEKLRGLLSYLFDIINLPEPGG